MATCMGQKFAFELEVTENKGDEAKVCSFEISLPYSIDGIVLNLPAMLAGQPETVYLSEFIPAPTIEDASEEEEIEDGLDEFDVVGDI